MPQQPPMQELKYIGTNMSLRKQIIYRILGSAVCILIFGCTLAIWQARTSVLKEVDASSHLALQLIALSLDNNGVFLQSADLSHFRTLQQTRHLSIQIKKPDGLIIQFTGDDKPSRPEHMPPAWFVKLVQNDYPTVTHQLKTQNGEVLTLLIQAQPLDEISEVWEESLRFLSLILALTLLTFIVVSLALNKSLKSIAIIVKTLGKIETGNYQQKLPPFAIQEFDSIANALNHMMEELDKTRQENRALTQHSLSIQEDERQRLSQELHDELGQSLTAIKVMAVTVAHPKADHENISAAIVNICNHLMLIVRSMMQQLHPLVLTELGLKACLEDLIQHWSDRNPDLNLIIDCNECVDNIDKQIAIQIFRVIQECLTNVIRHAHASEVNIRLDIIEQVDLQLSLSISDNGIGCDLNDHQPGFGLLGMKERIKSLNGEISFASAPNQGVCINVKIPL